MSIDWAKIPSQYNYAHRSACDHAIVIFTSIPLIEKGGRLFYPENAMVSCHATVGFTFPEGVLQISRPVVGDGQCIKEAVQVMRDQRVKGIQKYNRTIEAQDGYDVMGMLRMAQEEMADGAVYLAKLKMMLDRLRDHAVLGDIDAIKRELGL